MKTLMGLYIPNDKQRFPAFYPECEEKRPSTLFYADFKVAERFGMRAVFETMGRCGMGGIDKDKWREGLNERYTPAQITELYVVLNHLIWEAYEKGLSRLQEYYQLRYDFIRELSSDWTEEEREHFFKVTD